MTRRRITYRKVNVRTASDAQAWRTSHLMKVEWLLAQAEIDAVRESREDDPDER